LVICKWLKRFGEDLNELIKRGAKIKAYDSKVMDESKEFYLKDNPYDALNDADAMLWLQSGKSLEALTLMR